jgi:4-amino-4-deoxy-L-arabinose transferase-like glycosyltransferase
MKSRLKQLAATPLYIAGFAFLVRMVFIYIELHFGSRSGLKPVSDHLPYGVELGRVARAIAAGEGFSSPLPGVDSGPTAWFTPLYPYFIAGIFKVWGIYSAASHLVIQTLNSTFSALAVLPIYGITKRTFGRGVAIWAAWIWVFLPDAIFYPMFWIWDTTLVALIFLLIFWATPAMREKCEILPWLGYSALWALGVLINPSILSLLPIFIAWLVWEAHKAGVPWVKPVAAAALLFALCLVPWTVRNYRVFGKFIVLRSNFGLELWLGNNPDVADTVGAWQHPTSNAAEAAKFVRMGEMAYMADKQKVAMAYMRTHPLETLNFTFRRFEVFWMVFSDSPWDVWQSGDLSIRSFLVFNTSMTLLCLLGVLTAYREHIREAFLFAAVLLVFPLVFYFTHASMRLRFPIEPMMLILATGAVAHLLSLLRARDPHPKKAATPAPSLPAL